MAESFFVDLRSHSKTETQISKPWNRALAHMNVPKKGTHMFPSMVFSCFDIPGRKCGSARLGSVCCFTPINFYF